MKRSILLAMLAASLSLVAAPAFAAPSRSAYAQNDRKYDFKKASSVEKFWRDNSVS